MSKISPLSVIIHFPVERHVYKYLQKSVGEKLVASKKDLFGGITLDLLSKNDSRDTYMVKGELTYVVEISEDYMYRFGIYVDEKIKRKFNAYIDKMFRKEMITYVDINSGKKKKNKEPALREFLFYYNISEDDIKFETLVKYIQREL